MIEKVQSVSQLVHHTLTAELLISWRLKYSQANTNHIRPPLAATLHFYDLTPHKKRIS
jgi:hypothetical protein